MEFEAIQAKARQVAQLYARRDVERFGRPWNASELVLGFIGDVGDLAKLTQAKAGVRPHGELDKALEHELADCLWSLIVIADAFEIDLESAFRRTMGELSDQLRDDSERDVVGPTVRRCFGPIRCREPITGGSMN